MNSFLHVIYVKKSGCGLSDVDILAGDIKKEMGPSGPSADSLPFLLDDVDVRGLEASGYFKIYISIILNRNANPITGAQDAASIINKFVQSKGWTVTS